MYTTIIHPIRKALNLSINEYCVLESIRNLSNNAKYGGWCILSKSKIGDALDLSGRSVFTIVKSLLLKGLIEKNDRGDLRTFDWYNEIISSSNVRALSIEDLISVSPSLKGEKNNDSPNSGRVVQDSNNDSANSAQPMKKFHSTYEKFSHNTNNNTFFLKKETKGEISEKEVPTSERVSSKECVSTKNKKEKNTITPSAKSNYLKKQLTEVKLEDLREDLHFPYKVAMELYKHVEKALKDVGINQGATLKKAKGKWISECNLMIKENEFTTHDLNELFYIIRTDAFWKSQIRSAAALREKAVYLLLKYRTGKGVKNNEPKPTRQEF